MNQDIVSSLAMVNGSHTSHTSSLQTINTTWTAEETAYTNLLRLRNEGKLQKSLSN